MAFFNDGKWKGIATDAILEKLCLERWSNLYAFVRDLEQVRGFTIKVQGERAWLCVVKRYGDDGTPQVLFASGINFWDMWWAVNAAINKGEWKTDKFEVQKYVREGKTKDGRLKE